MVGIPKGYSPVRKNLHALGVESDSMYKKYGMEKEPSAYIMCLDLHTGFSDSTHTWYAVEFYIVHLGLAWSFEDTIYLSSLAGWTRDHYYLTK